MPPDHSIQRRVSRLEDETESIYEILTEIRSTQTGHTQRMVTMAAALAGHDQRLDKIDTTLTEHSRRLDKIDTTLTEIVRRLPERS